MDRTRRSTLLLLAALPAACGRAPDLVGIDNPASPAGSVRAATPHRLFLMTCASVDAWMQACRRAMTRLQGLAVRAKSSDGFQRMIAAKFS